MHTEVVQVLVASAARIQSSSALLSICAVCPGPPGTITTSGFATSSRVLSAVSARFPLSVRTGPVRSATNTVSESGRRPRVSYGPTASRAVKPS